MSALMLSFDGCPSSDLHVQIKEETEQQPALGNFWDASNSPSLSTSITGTVMLHSVSAFLGCCTRGLIFSKFLLVQTKVKHTNL